MTDPDVAGDQLRLGDLAAKIADELYALQQLSLKVQTALSHCTCARPDDIVTLKGLQGIDRVTQVLADLARLMADIGDQAASEICLKRTAFRGRVQLHELEFRLFANATSVPSDPDPDQGEVLLF